MPSIEPTGTQSYRVLALIPHRQKFIDVWRAAGLAPLVAGLLLSVLACLPDERPAGARIPAPPLHTSESEAQIQAESPDASLTPTPHPIPKPAARGLWILAEGSVRVLDDATRIGPTLDRAERLGATDLFVQVYRGGRAFYPGPESVERAPAAGRSDVLRSFLDAAHQRGFRVHAWVNALSLSTRRDAALLERLGRDAVLVDRQGRSILDYPDLELPEPDRRFYRMGTRGIYLDPALPAVREYLVTTFRDLVTRYPELDGLHLDYIRHPGVLPFSPGSRFGVGLEFGYGRESREHYRAETGRPDPIEGAAPGTVRSANVWDAWRRDQVTKLVEEIATSTRAARPGLVVSAAVISYFDRAYLSLGQDWRRWLQTGALDLAIPMAYTVDDRLLGYQLDDFAGWTESDRIWPGIGVWLFDDSPARAMGQLDELRSRGFSGEVLFSDDAIADSPGLLDALAVSRPGAHEPPVSAAPPMPPEPPRPTRPREAIPISSIPLEPERPR